MVMELPAFPETFTLDPASIANFVKLQRRIWGWKQQALASEAGVSLATIQRIERGERVRPAQLRKLAIAFRRPEDEFLRERVRPTPEEFEENLCNMFSWTEGRVPVDVAPFRTELQLRAMLESVSLLVDADLDTAADDDIAELREWLDLASFVQAERKDLIGPKPSRDFKVRELWRDLLACVERIEKMHGAICLTGIYTAMSTPNNEPVEIALLAIRSRNRDPSVAKLTQLWAEEKVDQRQILADYFVDDR